MSVLDVVIGPFADYAFMRRALAGGAILAIGAAPLGVFLVLRRMSLAGDALAHAILPGATGAALIAGLSIPAMTAGALAAALAVFLGAGLFSRLRLLPEDAGLAVFYLASLALGVSLASLAGGVDMNRLLFGSALALDDEALILAASAASLSALGLAAIYRPLALDTLDPGFLRLLKGPGGAAHLTFLALVAVNLVAGFQALGALMAVGLMVLPAIAARFWTDSAGRMIAAALTIALLGVAGGLLASFHADIPGGPAIVLALAALIAASAVFGVRDGLVRRVWPGRHLEA